MDAIEQFRAALAGRGIIPPEQLLTDGRLHRCDAEGKHGKKDAAYVLHLDGLPAGGFENHRDGQGWENWHAETGRTLSAAEQAQYRVKLESIQQHRRAEDAKLKQQAQTTAQQLWEKARPCTHHPYLARKKISACGAKCLDADTARAIVPHLLPALPGELLLLPLRDSTGTLHSLQWMTETGDKRFLKDGRKQGCYFSIGKPDRVLCIAEGFATAASIHESTQHAVAVAFDAGNLLHVARALREKFPDLLLVFCADDDHNTEGNPSLTKAQEAARAVNGVVAVPEFDGDRSADATDFNDLHQIGGCAAVARCIEATLQSASITEQGVQDATKGREQSTGAEPTTCPYADGRFEITPDGVFFQSDTTDRDGSPKPPLLICSPLHVKAQTRDNNNTAWGRLLHWQDNDGAPHQWSVPSSMLQDDGLELRRMLAEKGLVISPSKPARALLPAYLQKWPVASRARCVDKLGWYGKVYVLPDETIGHSDEQVVYQNVHAIEPGLSSKGTSRQWRDLIASAAAGNSRLVFALSAAFAGPLVELAGIDSGGFHLKGVSSTGKSTALKLAASVWGEPERYCRAWRATTNGLEGLAVLHNDNTLILDELGQLDSKQMGEAAYMLANGQGKNRSNVSGNARHAARWRLLFLSSGEQTLADLMMQAGQEIRLADIEADAGAGMGIFEQLHGAVNASDFVQELNENAKFYYGAVGMEWLRHIVSDQASLPEQLAASIEQFVQILSLPPDAHGQIHRVACRFALAAAAGELATHYGLTGWNEGEAFNAAKTCFTAWLDGFGGTDNRERRRLLEQVRAFFEVHAQSRFERINARGERHVNANGEQRIPNRAGFYWDGEMGTQEYLVLPEVFKREVCQGFDQKRAIRTLLDAGWLVPGKDGASSQKPYVSGYGQPRCYVLNAKMWSGE